MNNATILAGGSPVIGNLPAYKMNVWLVVTAIVVIVVVVSLLSRVLGFLKLAEQRMTDRQTEHPEYTRAHARSIRRSASAMAIGLTLAGLAAVFVAGDKAGLSFREPTLRGRLDRGQALCSSLVRSGQINQAGYNACLIANDVRNKVHPKG